MVRAGDGITRVAEPRVILTDLIYQFLTTNHSTSLLFRELLSFYSLYFNFLYDLPKDLVIALCNQQNKGVMLNSFESSFRKRIGTVTHDTFTKPVD